MALIVIDDALPSLSPELTRLIDNELIAKDWYDLYHEHLYEDFCISILAIARKYFDLSDAVGYEFWGHNGTRTGWHYDKDEDLLEREGKYSFPLCSTVYYLEVDRLQGGQLAVESDLITPKTNRLVMFSPGKYHTVEPFKGKRVSLLINPWSHPLCH